MIQRNCRVHVDHVIHVDCGMSVDRVVSLPLRDLQRVALLYESLAGHPDGGYLSQTRHTAHDASDDLQHSSFSASQRTCVAMATSPAGRVTPQQVHVMTSEVYDLQVALKQVHCISVSCQALLDQTSPFSAPQFAADKQFKHIIYRVLQKNAQSFAHDKFLTI